MNYHILNKKKSNGKLYIHFEYDGEKYFSKQLLENNQDNVNKMINEINMINYFSNYCLVPRIKEYNLSQNLLVLDYIDGFSLKNKILDIDKSVNIILNLCEILEVIHNHGYIFGDLKPSNVMISDKVYLIDFECVTKIGVNLNSASGMYCSPYQKKDRKAIIQFDLYSLGVIFLELLIGSSKVSNLYNENNLCNFEVSAVILNVPIIINKIVKKLLSSDCKKNYKSISELKNDIFLYIDEFELKVGDVNESFNN